MDTARITTNDVGAVLESLGVEAARATLLTEIGRVFGVYGIGVDARHLNLIADFMMHQVPRARYYCYAPQQLEQPPSHRCQAPPPCTTVMAATSALVAVRFAWPSL